MPQDGPQPGLRARTREAMRAEVARHALKLFDEKGFDQTTVEDIAASAGISPRSFFRYFPAKEDVVIGDLLPLGERIAEALRARPETEEPWAALRAALEPMVLAAEQDQQAALRVTRAATSTASLRARNLEKHIAWAGLLAPVIAARLNGPGPDAQLRATALVQSALACLDVALSAWAGANGKRPLREVLDTAFSALGHG